MKILKELQDDASQFQEFLQEVSIMRKVGSHVLWVRQAGELFNGADQLTDCRPLLGVKEGLEFGPGVGRATRGVEGCSCGRHAWV